MIRFLLFACLIQMNVISVLHAENCFTIVVGRKASADGSVLLAHNEDDGTNCVARLIPGANRRTEWEQWANMPGGIGISQNEITFDYWQLNMPGQRYSDVVCNARGVAIVTNGCPSREDRGELVGEGVGPGLRHYITAKARTAREGVVLAGSIIARFGYRDSGRTMVICDSREGWIMGLVKGKRWIAVRVPDDQVAVVSNSYSIRAINLADTLNCLGSSDLISYSTKRGWYAKGEGLYDFARAFADANDRNNPINTMRQWQALTLLSKKPIASHNAESLPFSTPPRNPVTVEQLFSVLRDHYEVLPYGQRSPQSEFHSFAARTICHETTNSSSVFQLRAGIPSPVATVWWLALWRPCSSVFIPLYPGAGSIPDPLGFEGDISVFSDPRLGVDKAYRIFGNAAQYADTCTVEDARVLRSDFRKLETDSILLQSALEKAAMQYVRKYPSLSAELLNRYSRGILDQAIYTAMDIMKKKQEKTECPVSAIPAISD